MLDYIKITEKTGYIILDQSLVVLHDISDRETVLIDSGYKESRELISFLDARGKRVPAVLCTHLHVDHIGNNGLLQRTYGAKIYVAEREKTTMENRIAHQTDITFEWMEREKYFYGDSGKCTLTPIAENETSIRIGDACFKIEKLTGHSPAHLGFATPDGVLHVGDSMMTDVVLKRSKIPYELSITKALETLQRLKVMDFPFFAASHMGVLTRDEMPRAVEQNISFHEDMLDEMVRRLDEWTEEERFIDESIAGRGVHIKLTRSRGWLPSAIRSYLGHLIRTGRIDRKTEQGRKYIKRIGKNS